MQQSELQLFIRCDPSLPGLLLTLLSQFFHCCNSIVPRVSGLKPQTIVFTLQTVIASFGFAFFACLRGVVLSES